MKNLETLRPVDDQGTESLGKSGDDNIEQSVHLETVSTPAPDTTASGSRHRDRLSRNPQHWPRWKKEVQIWMIAVHSMVSTFMAAGIIPAYEQMAEKYGVTMHEASYLTSSQVPSPHFIDIQQSDCPLPAGLHCKLSLLILLLGVAPLLWAPLCSRFGRHHICIFSVLGSMVCNIGGARCTSFGGQMTTRVLTAFLISPPIGIGGGIVTELAHPDERAEKLGYWTLLSVLGTPAGPFIMGFVVQHAGIEWIFWIFAMINFLQVLAYLVLGAETRYVRCDVLEDQEQVDNASESTLSRLLPRRIDATPLTLAEIFFPLTLVRHPRIIIPAISHAVIFCYANIAIVVEMPIAFGTKFKFDAQQVGLQFIAVIIGCALGEQVSGPLSDHFLKRLRTKRNRVYPADRLWLVYIGFGTIFAGLLTWGFQLEKATSWNVTPCIGAAIASFGNQIQTTILLSFAVDSHREYSTSISILTNFCRLVYGFFGPFYFPSMFESIGLGASAGVMCGIIVCFALVPTVVIQAVAFTVSRKEH